MKNEEIYQKAYSTNFYFKEIMDNKINLNSISIEKVVEILNIKNVLKKTDKEEVEQIDLCFYYLDLYFGTNTWYNIYKNTLNKIKLKQRKDKLKKLNNERNSK